MLRQRCPLTIACQFRSAGVERKVQEMEHMRKIIILMAMLAPIAACSSTERGAGIGAAGGAAIGGLATGSWEGAAVGAVAGGAAGALIGRANEPGKCLYRDNRGRTYEARC